MDRTVGRPCDRGGELLSAPDIVAVTTRSDLSADLVILAARRRGVDVFRFNTEDYPSQIGISVDPARPESAELITGDRTVGLGTARGLWIRRPKWPQPAREIADALDRALVTQEAVAAMGGVWRALRERCVSPPDVMQAARWKVAQLRVAHELGFAVPSTLITTDPGRAASFAASGETVIKAVADGRVQVGDEERCGGTMRLDPSWDLNEVRATPVLLQRAVDKIADVRVTAIGGRLFAVRIMTPPGSPLDFRLTDAASCCYEVVELDPLLADRLGAYLDWWGLRYGAFDLAEDADGTMWFLECNPAGQWAWLERFTGLDMTGALVDLLLDPTGGRG